jgi:hypothetical protein
MVGRIWNAERYHYAFECGYTRDLTMPKGERGCRLCGRAWNDPNVWKARGQHMLLKSAWNFTTTHLPLSSAIGVELATLHW